MTIRLRAIANNGAVVIFVEVPLGDAGFHDKTRTSWVQLEDVDKYKCIDGVRKDDNIYEVTIKETLASMIRDGNIKAMGKPQSGLVSLDKLKDDGNYIDVFVGGHTCYSIAQFDKTLVKPSIVFKENILKKYPIDVQTLVMLKGSKKTIKRQIWLNHKNELVLNMSSEEASELRKAGDLRFIVSRWKAKKRGRLGWKKNKVRETDIVQSTYDNMVSNGHYNPAQNDIEDAKKRDQEERDQRRDQ